MMRSSFTERLAIPRGVVARAVNGATVLLNSQSGRYFTLDDVGSRAWALLTTSPSIQAAYEALLAEFAADEDQVRGDLETLIATLESHGLIEIQRA